MIVIAAAGRAREYAFLWQNVANSHFVHTVNLLPLAAARACRVTRATPARSCRWIAPA